MVEFRSFKDFWPYYVREHSERMNRVLHFIGLSGAILCTLTALATWRPWLLLVAPLFGYSFAWFGHFVIEKNKPATFKYPLFSLGADFVMLYCIATGRMRDEVRKATGQS
jgi:hypothetical protein